MKKYPLLLAAVLAMLFCAFSAGAEVVASGTCGADLTWLLEANGTLTISGTGDMEDYTGSSPSPWFDYRRTSIKSIVIDSRVTSIGAYAFIGCQSTELKSVTIPDGVTKIGSAAFMACNNLPVITIPDSVTEIGESAFDSCCTLTDVTIPDGVTIIPNKAFYNCATLQSVIIPEGVTSIGEEAFSGCNELAAVSIPATVTRIDTGAFSNCPKLTEITIPADVESTGADPFYGCTILTRIILQGGMDQYSKVGENLPEGIDIVIAAGSCGTAVTYEMTAAGKLTITGSGYMADYDEEDNAAPWYEGRPGTVNSVVIDSNVKSIGSKAFCACDAMTGVTFNANSCLERIGAGAFYNCTGLTDITIPAGVTSIGTSAFADTGLTRVEFTGESCLTSIGTGAFPAGVKIYSNTPSAALKTTLGAENIIIADGSWGSDGYYVLNADSGLTITGSEEMGDFGMDEPYRAPWYDLGVNTESIVIGSGVTTIGDQAFFADNDQDSGFIHLTTVTIGSDVTSIGKYAFENCLSLSDVTFADGSRLEAILQEAFINTALSSSLTFPDTLKSIDTQAFANTGLSSVTLPDTMEDLAEDAFTSGCAINYKGSCGDGVTYLLTAEGELIIGKTGTGSGAMGSSLPWSTKAGSITSVTINSGVTSISAHAFEGCTRLTDVTLSDAITNIGAYAFSGCSGLTGIALSAGTTDIGEYAFRDCSYLSRIAIPNDNASIGDHAFSGCPEDITFVCTFNSSTMKNVMDRTENAFYIEDGPCVYYYSSTGLTLKDCIYWGSLSFDIPAGVTSIGKGAFSGCDLTRLSIPGSVTAIGDHAFPESTIITYNGTEAQWMQLANGRFGNNQMVFLLVAVTLDLKADDTDYSGETVLTCGRGKTLPLPTSIHKDGWSFLGWEYNGSIVTDVTPTEDITVSAGWQVSLDGMSTMTLPASLTTMGEEAFSGVAAQVIIIPDGCTEIKGTAFTGCEKLQYIVVPDSVSIDTVFEGCADTIHFLRKELNGNTVRYILIR